jgi:hypothetical protein
VLDIFLILPFVLQGIAMMVDEFYFHQRRGLGRWERIGHPMDSASVLIAFGILVFMPFEKTALWLFAAAFVVSNLLVTKDEFVHQKECVPAECWLHSLLFILHPLVLLGAALTWYLVFTPSSQLWREISFFNVDELRLWIKLQTGIIFLCFACQTVYWNILWKSPNQKKR